MRCARALAAGFSAGPAFWGGAAGAFAFLRAGAFAAARFFATGAFFAAGAFFFAGVLPDTVVFFRVAGARVLLFFAVVFFFVAMCRAPYRTLGNTEAVLYLLVSMSDARLEQFKKMVADFPDSPMSHFSLGKLYLERRQYADAAAALESAVRLDPVYAAALVALGDAWAGAGEPAKAREVLGRAREHALAQGHPGLAEEIDERLADLE